MAITLYYAPHTRAARVAFLLEELGVGYDRRTLDLAAEGAAVQAEREHIELLRRFGRYPGRNAALGRTCTAAELDYLGMGSR